MKKEKKGAIQLSFGVIFSIILIVFFVMFAFYVIEHFLDLQRCGEEGLFKSDLQREVDLAWEGEETSKYLTLSLPKKIEKVCFLKEGTNPAIQNLEYYANGKNVVFDDPEKSCMQSIQIDHLNIDEIIKTENPYCIENVDGKVELRIVKGIYESTVRIERV